MAITDPKLRAAYAQYWGVVAESARQGWSTATLWDAIRGAAASLGLDSPGVSASQISTLRGMAGQLQAASDRLQVSPGSFALTGDQIATPPWARPADVMNAAPQYQIRYLSTVATDQGESQVWRSITLGQLPGTHADLLDLIDQAVGANEGTYGEQFVNLDSYMLLAV